MSFHNVEQAPARLNRSELAVPGSQPQLFEKAAKSAADVIFLDLEDAVAPDDKVEARKNIIKMVQLFGGEGVRSGQVVETLYREIRALRIYEGATEVQKVIIARELLRGME